MVKQNKNEFETTTEELSPLEGAASTVSQDLRNSLLIVSIVANVMVFALWLTLQVTSQYNNALSSFFIG
ncbi:MAG TPA: hypothetical protein VJ841_00260 [Candidatus Saccharimonadales bacterium]|nr:hypothetical protein [Candidatus Saccharimonadales bacterium]